MTSDGDALLAAIIANPDEDAARLVYADWLQENGQEARAEFIRVQCELARNPQCTPIADGKTCRACDLLDRESRALVAVARSFSDGWLDSHTHCRVVGLNEVQYDSAPGNKRPQDASIVVTAHRGFAEQITCSAADWLAYCDAILTAQPVRRVVLTTVPIVRIEINGVWIQAGKLNRRYSARPSDHVPGSIGQALSLVWDKVTFESPPEAA